MSVTEDLESRIEENLNLILSADLPADQRVYEKVHFMCGIVGMQFCLTEILKNTEGAWNDEGIEKLAKELFRSAEKVQSFRVIAALLIHNANETGKPIKQSLPDSVDDFTLFLNKYITEKYECSSSLEQHTIALTYASGFLFSIAELSRRAERSNIGTPQHFLEHIADFVISASAIREKFLKACL